MLVIVRDGYWHRRAWSAWHAGLVANGSVRDFADLLPHHLAPVTAADRAAARERRNAHNFKLWCAVFTAADQRKG